MSLYGAKAEGWLSFPCEGAFILCVGHLLYAAAAVDTVAPAPCGCRFLVCPCVHDVSRLLHGVSQHGVPYR